MSDRGRGEFRYGGARGRGWAVIAIKGCGPLLKVAPEAEIVLCTLVARLLITFRNTLSSLHPTVVTFEMEAKK